MKIFKILVFLLYSLFKVSEVSAFVQLCPLSETITVSKQDTIKDNQDLYNGKIWKNLYYTVLKNQFLFSNEYLQGTVTVRNKRFTNIDLKYDIFKDELLTPVDHSMILQINKEMVDSFSLNFQNRTYSFIKLKDEDRQEGYYNILYKGKNALYQKYFKKIDKLAVEGKYDEFYQYSKLFFVKNGVFIQIRGKSDLLNAMDDRLDLVRTFIKKNKLTVSEKIPESFIPIVRYYNGLNH